VTTAAAVRGGRIAGPTAARIVVPLAALTVVPPVVRTVVPATRWAASSGWERAPWAVERGGGREPSVPTKGGWISVMRYGSVPPGAPSSADWDCPDRRAQ
jgi:hypothetical protein